MTSAPSYVAVKRKRDDAPIQSLILEERRTKHARVNVEYRLESVSQLSNSQPQPGPVAGKPSVTPASTNGVPPKPSGPRHFELAAPAPSSTGKRTADAAGLLPTFIERPVKRANLSTPAPAPPKKAPQKRPGTRVATNGSATRVLGKTPTPNAGLAAALQAFALEEAPPDSASSEDEHEHEADPPPRPRVIVQPKRSVRRRKEEDTAPGATPGPADREDEDYVYDIYIRSATRAPAASLAPPVAPSVPPPPAAAAAAAPPRAGADDGPIDPSAPRTPSLLPLNPDSTAPRSLLESYAAFSSSGAASADEDVGYLILPPDASSSAYFWGSAGGSGDDDDGGDGAKGSRDGSGADSDGHDDEDSNAEDYYGADYPEDEVDEDDEMGVGEWRFRRGSEDEDDFATPGWAGRGEGGGGDGWSDSEVEDEGTNPWRRIGRT